MSKQTDQHWERYGKIDPYYGVLTDPKFKRQNIDSDGLREFFDTGESYIGTLFERIRMTLDPEFEPRTALDFGCGVGRLAIPMARRCGQVHGMDVSDSMLKEAAANATRFQIGNLTLYKSDDGLSAAQNDYDFVNSAFVLQHVPPERGMQIFGELLSRVSPGGVFSLQVPYHSNRSALRAAVGKLRRSFAWANYAANLLEGRPHAYPHIEMNVYPLQRLLRMIQLQAVEKLWVEFINDPDFPGVVLIGQKPRQAIPRGSEK